MTFDEQAAIWAIGGAAAALWIASAGTVIGFRRACRRRRKTSLGASPPARVDVLMPVRNGGPDLRRALEHLSSLDYPNYYVHVVIDRPDDPAVPIVCELRERFADGRLRYEFLTERPATRSLLCSALVQVFNRLDDDCDLLAVCAADMNFPSNYFINLTAPMTDPEIGCTLGNRWYHPPSDSFGSIMRYLYNAGAIIPMWLLSIPWGGAAALRPDDVRRSGLLERWKRGMVEDAPIAEAVRRIDKRLAFVPELIVPNDDPIGTAACYEFLKRQLMWTRLYHDHWPSVVVGTALTTAVTLSPWCAAAVALLADRPATAGTFAAVGFAYWCGFALLLWVLQHTVQGILERNGQRAPSWSPGLMLRITAAIPLALLFYCAAMVQTTFLRRVRWSNVEYEIRGPYDVRMIAGAPDRPVEALKSA